MRENDRRIRLSLNAVSGEKWFREGKNHFKCAFWRAGPKTQTKIDSETPHLLLPIYDIASETIRIESLVQVVGANKGIALT
jgi:hypothetical protein